MNVRSFPLALAATALATACTQDSTPAKPSPVVAEPAKPTPPPAPEVKLDPAPPLPAAILGLPDLPAFPDSPMTPEKVALGKRLFFDKRLSKDGSASCETCHQHALGWTDGKPFS